MLARGTIARPPGLGVEGDAALHLVGGTEVLEVARVDLLDGQDDQHVGGAELAIDDGAVADEGAEPEVALDQGGIAFSAALASILSLARRSIGT